MRNEEEGCWTDSRVYSKIALESRLHTFQWKWEGKDARWKMAKWCSFSNCFCYTERKKKKKERERELSEQVTPKTCFSFWNYFFFFNILASTQEKTTVYISPENTLQLAVHASEVYQLLSSQIIYGFLRFSHFRDVCSLHGKKSGICAVASVSSLVLVICKSTKMCLNTHLSLLLKIFKKSPLTPQRDHYSLAIKGLGWEHSWCSFTDHKTLVKYLNLEYTKYLRAEKHCPVPFCQLKFEGAPEVQTFNFTNRCL